MAGETNVDVVILLSDVEGLYKEPPSASGKRGEVIDTYEPDAKYIIGASSRSGTRDKPSNFSDSFVVSLIRACFIHVFIRPRWDAVQD